MSAIQAASITVVDVETKGGVPGVPQSSTPSMRVSHANFVKTQGFFPGDRVNDSNAIPAPQGSVFPSPHGPEGAPPKAPVASSAHFWPAPRPGMTQTLGADLLKEFDAIYHVYEPRVYRQCYRMLGNQEDAEDLTQEVFLQVFRKIHTYRGEANFSTWLHSLTVNTVLMRIRRHRRWRQAVTSLDAPQVSEGAASDVLTLLSALSAPAVNRLEKIGLDRAIAQLSSGYREVFLLHDAEGYRHEEIAKLLGISAGTSKSQLHKARLRIRELMG